MKSNHNPILETQYRSHIKDLLLNSGIFAATIEHRSGGTAGFPDLLVQCGELLLPVEIKLARLADWGPTLRVSRIRPTQISLLETLSAAGVRARLLLVEQDSKRIWLQRDVSRSVLRGWRAGFEISELVLAFEHDKLLLPVDQW